MSEHVLAINFGGRPWYYQAMVDSRALVMPVRTHDKAAAYQFPTEDAALTFARQERLTLAVDEQERVTVDAVDLWWAEAA